MFENGGIGLLVYFLIGTILLPMLLALFFLLNKNGLHQRAAVLFLAVVLLGCTGWAMVHGNAIFKPSSGLIAVFGPVFLAGNFVGPIVLAWLAWG